MKKRTECYICSPIHFDLFCPVDENHKITWSEFEQHIWCYDCQKDIKYKPGDAIIALGISRLLGIDYRRYNIKTGKIVEYEM